MSRTSKIAQAITVILGLTLAPAAMADQATSLRAALDKAAAKDWQGALTEAQGAGTVGADVILWQWLRDGQGKLGDYESFLTRRPDWPGLPLLREKGEIAVARSTDAARIIAYFGGDAPRTGLGAVTLVRALLETGQRDAAEAEALRAWAVLKFDSADEDALLALMSDALSVAHEVRLDNALWDGDRRGEATRMLARVGADWAALGQARLALQTNAANASGLVEGLPQAVAGDAGLAYDRFVWRMQKDRYDDAAALLIERSTSVASLGRPEAWAERRALLARRFMRTGDAKTGYTIASQHQLEAGDAYVDLEFLSGFIALRKLGDPDRALGHFTRLKAAVATPISVARADYWLGRALEAKGDAAGAKAAFQAAAQNQTAFYGLMAAEKLGLSLDPALVEAGQPGAGWKTAGFAGSSVLAAARSLLEAGDRTLAKRFLLHLGESLTAQELEQLADLALRLDEPHIALLVAKSAAERGLILARSYYPVPDMVPDGLPVSRALALAISRRESEFDPRAQSPVGARGLMQVMPETAARVAQRLGEESSTAKLTADPAFNVRVGSEYLRQMVEEFGPSVALIASGYNAGPGRPRNWIKDFGDPRRADVDVVDWVETIPFTETRTYVMRVAEGVVIYRARLAGVSSPVRISAELTGR